jgi:hypothetical protein
MSYVKYDQVELGREERLALWKNLSGKELREIGQREKSEKN